MHIPILSGIYTDTTPDYRTAYPVNMVPVPKVTGITEGYLKPADGIRKTAQGAGPCRGGIVWDGEVYRVLGPKLCKITASDAIIELADLPDDGSWVRMDYGFDRLSISCAGHLYYWDGSGLTIAGGTGLGYVLDHLWADGYWMTTDGEFLVVTELTDPTKVNPYKYGSSESDPDPIKAILRIRNEVYAVNRNTIECFSNVGGQFFPFQRVAGAQIQKGAVGTFAACIFQDSIGFVGGGRNEPPSVYVGMNGSYQKIATREVETMLAGLTDEHLESVRLEARKDEANDMLYVYLPDRCLVFDAATSKEMGKLVWFVLTSALDGYTQYRAVSHQWCNGRWHVGDPTSGNVGVLDPTIATHWGEKTRWEFASQIIYNESRGAVFNELELVGIPRPNQDTIYPPGVEVVIGTPADVATYPNGAITIAGSWENGVTAATSNHINDTTYSDFSSLTGWSNGANLTLTTSGSTAPNSSPWIDLVEGAGSIGAAARSVAARSNTPIKYSLLVKKGTRRYLRLTHWIGGIGGAVIFDLDNVTANPISVGGGPVPTASIVATPAGDLVVSSILTFNAPDQVIFIRPSDAAGNAVTGVGGAISFSIQALTVGDPAGRWLRTGAAGVTATDVSYVPATGVATLTTGLYTGGVLQVAGQSCTLTTPPLVWQAPATYVYASERVMTGWTYNPATGALATPDTRPGSKLYADGVECYGSGMAWNVPPLHTEQTVSTSYSVDGLTWSQDKRVSVGGGGYFTKRMTWYKQGHMRNWRIQRFRGTSDATITASRIEAQIDPLGV